MTTPAALLALPPNPSTQHTLFPACEPHRQGRLAVSDLHELYFEESGNPNGLPVLFLHGGPGGGSEPGHRRFFDPGHYRVVLMDQRGAGQSTPHACIQENTTWDLVDDLERLRKHLRIDRWVVFGGSWGSTLALAYAEAYPAQVLGLIVRGVCLLTQSELDWFFRRGASMIFPEAWEEFQRFIPKDEQADLLLAYHRRVHGPDPAVRQAAAYAFTLWEAHCTRLLPDPYIFSRFADPHFSYGLARIETHYFVHRGFFQTDGQLLINAHRLARIPTTIIQGRYDLICPMESAYRLAQAVPHAEFVVVGNGGHAAIEPGTTHQLILATEEMKTRVSAR